MRNWSAISPLFVFLKKMIQRIQSLYLALVVILSGLSFAFPLAEFYCSGFASTSYNLIPKEVSADATFIPQTTVAWSAIGFSVMIGVFSLIAIFMYKNRMKQIRVVASAFLLCVIYTGLLFLLIISAQADALAAQGVTVTKIIYGISSYLPIAQIVLLILAQQAIKKDEKLVRSSERLR